MEADAARPVHAVWPLVLVGPPPKGRALVELVAALWSLSLSLRPSWPGCSSVGERDVMAV